MELCIAADYDTWVRLGAHCSVEGFTEMLGRDGLIVDPQPASLVYGDQDSASFVALRVRFRRFGQLDVRYPAHLRRDHHEDDRQHQPHVNRSRDVYTRL